MRVNPAVFKAYDIRGTYGRDFDAAFAQRLGQRIASHLKDGALVVGRDVRSTSDELAYAVIDGAMHTGARVIDAGELSSPQLYWAVRALDAAGGIMITASHNAGTDNGFKVISRGGEVIGGHQLRQIYDSPGRAHRTTGALEYYDAVPGYADAVAYAAGWQGGRELRLSIEAPQSVLRVLERMGPIAPDHGLAARFDSDGDRVAFYDGGVQVPAEFVMLLLAERMGLSPLVLDLRFSRIVRERLTKQHIPYTISRVGRLYLTEAMRATGAAFGGETSGHFFWKEFGGMEAPELTLLRIYTIVAESRYSLHDLVAPYRKYFKSEEVNLPAKDVKHANQMAEALVSKFPGCQVERTDGVTVDCWEKDGFWCNARPSNTEALLRVVVEAKKKDLLEQKLSEVRAALAG